MQATNGVSSQPHILSVMHGENMKKLIAISIMIFFIGCVSLDDSKNRTVYYQETIGIWKLWKVHLKKEISEEQANKLKKYAIAIFNSKNQLIHVIIKEDEKDVYQVYYFYDQSFYNGKSPYKRTRIDSKGENHTHIHGMYEGIKK